MPEEVYRRNKKSNQKIYFYKKKIMAVHLREKDLRLFLENEGEKETMIKFIN
jgi:hypothetical protein